MKTIVEYKILEHGTPAALSSNVNKRMQEGWQPLGGCVIARTNENQLKPIPGEDLFSYFQTMVKYEE